ncbi:MAG: hypothetical protein NTY69_09700 [Methylococcales bacterium]|nr:hypothetical protein [Methylococcales bacterium]
MTHFLKNMQCSGYIDINLVILARNKPLTGLNNPKDVDKNGVINALDVRKQTLLCTRPRCAR